MQLRLALSPLSCQLHVLKDIDGSFTHVITITFIFNHSTIFAYRNLSQMGCENKLSMLPILIWLRLKFNKYIDGAVFWYNRQTCQNIRQRFSFNSLNLQKYFFKENLLKKCLLRPLLDYMINSTLSSTCRVAHFWDI